MPSSVGRVWFKKDNTHNAPKAEDSPQPDTQQSQAYHDVDQVWDEQVVLLQRVYNYLYLRLNLYVTDIMTISRRTGLGGSGTPNGHFVTSAAFTCLFTCVPGSRFYVCEPLSMVGLAFKKFWTGFQADYTILKETTQPLRGQPSDITSRYYLFFEALFKYLYHVRDNVSSRDFVRYKEFDELELFLVLVEQTKILFLALAATSGAENQEDYRHYAEKEETLADLLGIATDHNGMFKHLHFNARSKVAEAIDYPIQPCKEGDFGQLDAIVSKAETGYALA